MKVNDNHVNIILSKRKTEHDCNTIRISRHRQVYNNGYSGIKWLRSVIKRQFVVIMNK